MKLDQRGDVSIAEIILYIPILIISVRLVLRHGLTRRAGWIFLLLLSIIRIVGGITHIASEQDPSNITLIIVYSTMEASGVSPLLLATLGFLRTVCQHSLEDEPLIARGLRLMGLLGTVALALAVAGGVIEGEATKESSLTSGQNLRHIGVILFAVLLGLIVLVHVFCWMNSGRILKHRRTLLAGISVALPCLVVRVAYTVLSAYAPLTRSIAADGQVTSITSDSPLTKFNSTTGPWIIYLLMSVVPEFIAVVIYVIVGTKIPLQDDTDYSRGAMSEAWDQGSDEEHARLKPLRTASSNYSQY